MTTPKPLSSMPGIAALARVCRASALALLLSAAAVVAMAPPARGEEAADPASVLENLREKRKLQDEEQQREFQRLVEEGKGLLAQHAYGQARQVLARAASLRPGDEACARLLAQAEAGSPAASSEQLLERVKTDQQTKSAMLQVQLGASLFEAEKALKAGDHARAREHAERVLDSVAYVSETDRAAKLRAQAEAILASARAAGDKAQAAELQGALAAHRERATRDKEASVLALNRQGWQHLDKGDANAALAVADDMLRLEPGNRQGIYLRQEAQRVLDRRRNTEALAAERKEAGRKILVDQMNEEMTVPSKEDRARIVLPGKSQTKDYTPRPGEKAREPWEEQLRAKLRQPVDVDFRNTTIAEACRYLSQAADCPMVVDPSVAQDTKRLTLPTMTISLEHALRWLCRFAKATYTLRDHAILVTTRGGVLDQPVTQDYDISSLLVPNRAIRTTFNGPSQADEQSWVTKELLGGASGQAPRPEEGRPVPEDALGEAWVQFIRSTVAPETWEEPAKEGAVLQAQQAYTISYRNGRIVVVHTPEVQEQIGNLLDDFRRARNLQVHIFARFLVVQTDFLERMDLDFTGPNFDLASNDLSLAPGALTPAEVNNTYGFVSEPGDPWQAGVNPPRRSVIGYLYNDSQVSVGGEGELSASGPLQIRWAHTGSNTVNAILQAVVKRRKGTILAAPRLTCFNTQRANFQAITNYNYVRSVSSDGEPEIGNVPDGIIFDVQPFVSTDRRYITLVLQPQMRTLRNRSSLQSTGFGYAIGPVVQRNVNLPDTELRSVATTVSVPDGGTMLVGGLSTVRERAGEANVPIINRMPLLRYIFREWTQFDSRQSLVILVTAEIVPDVFEE